MVLAPPVVMAAPLRLRSALALVTGGGSGIGRAVCARLAREGALVAVADQNEAGAAETVRGLARGEPGQEHEAFGVDVRSAQSVGELMAHIQGTFLITQAVARGLVESGAPGGSIINMGSIVGKVGNLGQVSYAASKAGVEGLTKTAAKELARFGIRCNVVLPGFITTPMTDKVPPKVLQKFAGMVPLGRLGDPEEVADVCAFLASEDSRYITGASVEVTGGLFL
ncbi:(3R)-3-hydroxyacyl-CoA dehydrogenase isoform X2 [Emydura macquarii macquarii]|uniref:(3R)-3-hydroxyacyl-CoA dehydrogenase isoform X2 n=1 Tax=Emydura macquarii macquarii TaxID=1129001 RepID=UPI00352A522D